MNKAELFQLTEIDKTESWIDANILEKEIPEQRVLTIKDITCLKETLQKQGMYRLSYSLMSDKTTKKLYYAITLEDVKNYFLKFIYSMYKTELANLITHYENQRISLTAGDLIKILKRFDYLPINNDAILNETIKKMPISKKLVLIAYHPENRWRLSPANKKKLLSAIIASKYVPIEIEVGTIAVDDVSHLTPSQIEKMGAKIFLLKKTEKIVETIKKKLSIALLSSPNNKILKFISVWCNLKDEELIDCAKKRGFEISFKVSERDAIHFIVNKINSKVVLSVASLFESKITDNNFFNKALLSCLNKKILYRPNTGVKLMDYQNIEEQFEILLASLKKYPEIEK